MGSSGLCWGLCTFNDKNRATDYSFLAVKNVKNLKPRQTGNNAREKRALIISSIPVYTLAFKFKSMFAKKAILK